MNLWVFGYGSLCWNPGFNFVDSCTGHVKGYTRKFWQGNTTHRGTAAKPGRVATLIEDNDSVVWGRAFLISDTAALPYLNTREVQLGGYTTRTVTFYPQDGHHGPIASLIYLATPENDQWLGDAPEHVIAHQILTSCGSSGHNVEYLLRLADFMREHLPEAEDEHLFRLEELVRSGGREVNQVRHQRRSVEQHADRVQTNKLRCLSI